MAEPHQAGDIEMAYCIPMDPWPLYEKKLKPWKTTPQVLQKNVRLDRVYSQSVPLLDHWMVRTCVVAQYTRSQAAVEVIISGVVGVHVTARLNVSHL